MAKKKQTLKKKKARFRTFNKKEYTSWPRFQGLKKSQAQIYKKRAKESKNRARVIEKKAGHDVYMRPGTRD